LEVEWLGFCAGALTTICLVPQVYRVYKFKSAHDISLSFTVLFLLGIVLWLAYGVFSGLAPIVLWNSATLVLASALLIAKLRYGK
jgi:MtN3 and saliva related transmembrane protein